MRYLKKTLSARLGGQVSGVAVWPRTEHYFGVHVSSSIFLNRRSQDRLRIRSVQSPPPPPPSRRLRTKRLGRRRVRRRVRGRGRVQGAREGRELQYINAVDSLLLLCWPQWEAEAATAGKEEAEARFGPRRTEKNVSIRRKMDFPSISSLPTDEVHETMHNWRIRGRRG